MSTKSAEMASMDALWRAYVNADPDLHRMEHRKQTIAHRRIWVAHAKKVRREAGRAILHDLAEMAGRVVVGFVFVVILFLMVCLA